MQRLLRAFGYEVCVWRLESNQALVTTERTGKRQTFTFCCGIAGVEISVASGWPK